MWGIDSKNSKYVKYFNKINENLDKSYVIFLYNNTSFLFRLVETENSEQISLQTWKDPKYNFIIRLQYIKELGLNKNQIYLMHGYQDRFALRGMMYWKQEHLKVLEDIIYPKINNNIINNII
jgi:hypothetical protein